MVFVRVLTLPYHSAGPYREAKKDIMASNPRNFTISGVFLAFSRFSVIFMLGKKLLTTDLTTYGFDRKIEYFHPSGCGAAGSARSLGLRCRRFESGHSDQKSRSDREKAVRSAKNFIFVTGGRAS